MPQGLLQVNRFVTPQNSSCTVSGAINRAKSNCPEYFACKSHALNNLRGKFLAAQWNQDLRVNLG